MKTLTKSKIIGKIRQKITQKASRGLGRGQKGSTIVAVMAAMVFIGIVVAGMLRNTGSQSVLSRGYASAFDMSSTVQSGFVATEGFFLGDVYKGLAIIDTLVQTNHDTTKKTFVYGSLNQGRKRLATSDQYFSSTAIPKSVHNLINTPDSCVRAGFLVAAGKNAKGKDFRAGRTFLQFENLKQILQIGNVGAKNAVYTVGGIENADAGMKVDSGGATFMGYAKFQNAAAIFEQSAFFGNGASFMKDSVRFKQQAYFADSVAMTEFHVPAIFDSVVIFKGPVIFQSTAPATFKEKAYFMKHAEFQGTVNFTKGAYFAVNDTTIKFQKTAAFNRRVYFKSRTKFESSATFDTSYFGGNSEFTASATFKNITQFDGAVTFNGDASFGTQNMTVWNTDDNWTYFGGNVVFGKESKFYGETYFKGTVKLPNNNDLEFFHRVGFDGDITLNNRTIYSKKYPTSTAAKFDVFIHGKFADANINSGKVRGMAGVADHGVYYSSTFATVFNATNALVDFDKKSQNADINTTVFGTKIVKITDALLTLLRTAPIVPNSPTAADRRDPQLSIDSIYVKDEAHGGSVKIHNAKTAMTFDGSTFNIDTLKSKYNKALENPNSLYYGHMVIEITSPITSSSEPGIFDAKIIYIIKAGGSLHTGGGFFYSSSSDTASLSSTLIYVGAGNASLQQFGTKGTFRGFIYIDAANTSNDNSIKFQTNGQGKIVGAVHNFSSKPLTWNTGLSQYSTPIVFCAAVINNFASLYPSSGGTPSTNANVTLKVNGQGIDVKLLGVYFH